MIKKVVFITGASRGIGLATVKKFILEGWYVAGFYNQNPGPDVKNCRWYQLELSDPENISFSFSKAYKNFGQINCLVNNAGIFGYKNLAEYDEKLIDRVIAINEKGTYLATQAVLDKM